MKRNAAAWSAKFVSMLLVASLAACGGGGGGGSATTDSGSSSGSSGTSSTANSQTPLVLDTNNANNAGVVALYYGILPLSFAQVAADWTNALSVTNGASQQIACPGGGTVTVSVTGLNGNNQVVAGTQLTATLSACNIKPIQDAFNGSFTITYSTPASGYQLSGTIDFGSGLVDTDGGGVQATMVGQINFDYNASSTVKSVHAYAAKTPLGVTISTEGVVVSDAYTTFDCLHQISLTTARTSSTMNYGLNSGLLQGNISVATTTPLASYFDTYPDSGSLTVTGAAGSTLQLVADNGDVNLLALSLNGASAGTMTVTGNEYLFSGTGWISQDSSSATYSIGSATAQGFQVLQQPTLSGVAPNSGAFSWIFSRPLASNTVSTIVFNDVTLNQNTPWVAAQIGSTISVQGALLTVTPTAQFNPGDSYQLVVSASGSAIASSTISDTSADTLAFNPGNLSVTDSVNATLVAATPSILLGPSSSLSLDASGSTAIGSIQSWNWSQISGPTVQFSSTSSAITVITPNTTSNGLAVIQVQVTDASGNIATRQITIPVFGVLTNALAISVTSSAGTGDNLETNAASATGLTISTDNSAQVLDVIDATGATRLLAETGTGSNFVTGAQTYNNSVTGGLVASFTDNAASYFCTSGTASGNFNVLAISYSDPTTLSSLALDFDQTCSGTGVTVQGSVRFNSGVPLRQ